MGELRNVYRKIAKWTEHRRDPEYTATLECGHAFPGEYDEPLPAETKAVVDAAGEVICAKCSREEYELEQAEARVRELKAKRRGRGSPSGSEGE